MEGKSSSSKTAETRGKEQILCFYCDQPMRKDNLERHTEKKHPNQTSRFKLFDPKQKTVTSMFPKKEETVSALDIQGDFVQEEDVSEKWKLDDINDDLESQTKKAKYEGKDIKESDKTKFEFDESNSIDEKLKLVRDDLKSHFDKGFSNVVEQMVKNSKENSSKEDDSKVATKQEIALLFDGAKIQSP